MDNSAQLVDSEQRFRSLFENNPDLVLFQNKDGVILDANQAFLSLLEKPKTQVLDHTLESFLPPVLVPLFQQKLHEAFQGIKVRFDAEVQFDSKAPRMYDVTKVPLKIDGMVAGIHAVFRDITDVTAAQQLVHQQAQKLNTIFESITDAFFLLDREWRFTYVNSEVVRLLGMPREELVHQSVWRAFPEEVDGPFHRYYQQAMDTGQSVHFEAFLERMHLWLDVKVFPSDEGLSVYFSDVTDRVRAHEELYRQNNDLQQFTYIVSHNLRAPLANIMGLVNLLTSLPHDSEDFYVTQEHLRTNAYQLDNVLQDMNTILSIRDTQDVAAAELVPVADVLEQARRTLEEPMQQVGGTMEVGLPAGLRVKGNRAYLYSIFFNLLSNAIKYGAETRPLQVVVQGSTSPEYGVRITFSDNGSGFDQEKAGADVFKLYKRFHAQQAGRGMGLYLVKTHVEAMGGRIEVSSQVDVGTRFIIHLR